MAQPEPRKARMISEQPYAEGVRPISVSVIRRPAALYIPLEYPIREQQQLKRVGMLHQHRPRVIQPKSPKIIRHVMPRVSNFQQEALSSAYMHWRRYLHVGLDYPAALHVEAIGVARCNGNGSAARAL